MKELQPKRTLFSKTFDLGGGQRRLDLGQLPMHFGRDGRLIDIDLTPVLDIESGLHSVKSCPYSLRVSDTSPSYAYNSLTGQRVSVELDIPSSKPLVEGDLFKWGEVGPDTDYIIQPLPLGCATFLILHSSSSPKKWRWKIDGDKNLLSPLTGKDSAGRRLELIETFDPSSKILEVEWTGRTISPRVLRKDKKISWGEEVTWPVVIDPTVNENVTAGTDDVRSSWKGNGATFNNFDPTGTRLFAGQYTMYRSYAGIRFQTIPIPPGATINSATLTVRFLSLSGFGSPDINIYGNAVDDAPIFANPGARVKNMTKTSAVVNQTSWTNNADNAITVTSIIAELLARPGWASNNDVAFGFFNNKVGTGNHFIGLASLEHATLTEARLAVDYTLAAATAFPFSSPSAIHSMMRR